MTPDEWRRHCADRELELIVEARAKALAQPGTPVIWPFALLMAVPLEDGDEYETFVRGVRGFVTVLGRRPTVCRVRDRDGFVRAVSAAVGYDTPSEVLEALIDGIGVWPLDDMPPGLALFERVVRTAEVA